MSLNDMYTVARSGILSHQERLAMISNNIANVNTPGYHKQRAVLSENPSLSPIISETRKYEIGAGVTVASVVRTYDQMKETMLQEQQSSSSYHDTKAPALADLEAVLNGTGATSLSQRFSDFWTSWQDLANTPDSLATRSVLIQKSAALADQIQLLNRNLDTFRTQIAGGGAGPQFTGTVSTTVDEFNTKAAQLQDLNYRIAQAQNQDYSANSLMDQRGVLLNEISQIADITVGADYSVRLGGQLLVSADGSIRNTLSITSADSPITLELDGSTVTPAGGKLGAWLDVADVADSMSGRLDTIASELINAINTIHNSDAVGATGDTYDLNGNRCNWDFFTGTDASDIAVNSAIHDPNNPLNDSPELIAAAATRFSAGPPPIPNQSDGAKALEIAAVADLHLSSLNSQTFAQYFESGLTALGSMVASEEDQAKDGAAIVNSLQDAIQKDSGVSLDEEMAEMIQAQRAYEASAKVFTTVDGLVDLIVNQLKR